MSQEKGMENQKKIVLTGLAAAGKTSILRALDQDFVGLHQLTPTKGVEHTKIKIFGVEIFRWDMGGQEIYREKYILEKERYFSGTNLVIYVLDIQEENIEPNLNYLKKVFAALHELEVKPHFAVFFHKYDPRILLSSVAHRKRMEIYIQDIDGMKGDIETWFYPTSIYDIPSLITSFSHVFVQIFPQQELLAKQLEEIREKFTIPALAVTDMSPFLISKSYSRELESEQTKQFETRLFSMTRQLKGKGGTSISWNIEPYNDRFSIVAFLFPVKTEKFVLTGLFPKEVFHDVDQLRQFDTSAKGAIQSIRKILEHFYI